VIIKLLIGLLVIGIAGGLWYKSSNFSNGFNQNAVKMSDDQLPINTSPSPAASSPSPIPLTSHQPTVDPTSSPTAGKLVINLNQQVTLSVGETVSLGGTDIKVTVVSATLADAKMSSAKLSVSNGQQTQSLQYYIQEGSDANEEVLARMRQKTAFGYTFTTVNINTNSITVRVTK